MNENKFCENTEASPKIPVGAAIALGITAALFCSLAGTPLGGILSLTVSAALLGLLLTAEQSFYAFLPIPFSYVLAVVFTGDPLLSLLCFLSVPGAFALRICYSKKFCLSVTVIITAVCMGVSYALILLADLYVAYGSLSDAYAAIKGTVGAAVDETFALLNEIFAGEQNLLVITDETVYLFKKMLLMSAPGIFVILAQVAAYCAEKLMRAFSRLYRCSFVAQRPERVTLSLGAAIIFLVCYGMTSLFSGDTVIYYSAENLMMVTLPLASVAGMHSMFGKESLFRQRGRTFIKISTILLCIMAFYASPLMLFILFALWGSAGTVARAVLLHAMSKKD